MKHVLTSYKQYLCSIIILFSVFACSEKQENKSNGDFETDEKTQWITDNRNLPESDSLFYLNNPSPFFRTEFTSDCNIESAKLYITAAG